MNDRWKNDPDASPFSQPRKWRGRRMRFFRNRLVLKFKDDFEDRISPQDQMAALLSKHPLRPRRSARIGKLTVLDILPPDQGAPDDHDQALLDQIEELSLDDDLEFVEPDLAMITLLPALPRDAGLEDQPDQQWGWLRIGMDRVWQFYPGNEHVVVGVLDTGLYDHVDLDLSRVAIQEAFAGGDFVGNDAADTTVSTRGHGTMVLGIIAATQDNPGVAGITGINGASDLYVCKVVEEGLEKTTASNIFAAMWRILGYAEAHDLKAVVNISWAADHESLTSDQFESALPDGVHTFDLMCAEAQASERMILCCGAGNFGGSGVTTLFPARMTRSYPETVLAVGATSIQPGSLKDTALLPDPNPAENPEDDLEEGIWANSAAGDDISVVAPGDRIKVLSMTPPDELGAEQEDPRNGTGWDAGTSLATAFSTGLTSILWSANPDLPPGAIIDAIKNTAQSPGDGPMADWGFGRIYAPDALDAVRPRPTVVFVRDLTHAEANRTLGFTGFLQELAAVFQADMDILVAGGASALNHHSFASALTGPLDPGAENFEADLLEAFGLLNEHSGLISAAPPFKSVFVLAGGSSSLTPDTILALESERVSRKYPVFVFYHGDSDTGAYSTLERAVALTRGKIVDVTNWANEIEAGYWLSRFVALAMGRTIIVKELWSPVGMGNEISFQFDLGKNDMDVDVLILHGIRGIASRALEVNNVDVLDVEPSAPGIVVESSERYTRARIATGTAAKSGTWSGRIEMADYGLGPNSPLAVLVSKRSRA